MAINIPLDGLDSAQAMLLAELPDIFLRLLHSKHEMLLQHLQAPIPVSPFG
ncbi:hypothetical protein D3C85_1832940 [compost metagenome]